MTVRVEIAVKNITAEIERLEKWYPGNHYAEGAIAALRWARDGDPLPSELCPVELVPPQ